MSACSNTLRALSRSRNSPSRTLLPFLYQTATIQQWRPLAQSTTRRTITSRRKDPEADIPFARDIPFEHDVHDVPAGAAHKATMTGTERAAFEKLYKRFSAQGRMEDEKYHEVELDQIADEYYEDDEQPSQPSLDEIFQEVWKGAPSRATHMSTRGPKNAEPELSEEMDAVKQKIRAERRRITELMHNAPTDRALWQILEREVFDKVRELDLDGKKTPKAQQSKTKPDPPSDEARVFFQVYPQLLVRAASILRTQFPASPLPLSILPAIRALGRSSHALGATVELYKLLIRCAWVQQASYSHVDTLLTDMNNGAIEFDPAVLALLHAMIKEYEMASGGLLGKEMNMVYKMEMFVEGIGKIKAWKEFVAERLGATSQEKQAKNIVVRRVDSQREKLWRGISRTQNTSRVGPRRSSSPDFIPLAEGINPPDMNVKKEVGMDIEQKVVLL